MTRLELRGVTKVYRTRGGEVRALAEVSFSVAAGEFALVKGPSGSGKTTLLLIAGSLLRPSAGTVRLDGDDLAALPEERRRQLRRSGIGFVFQSSHLVPYLTAAENVMLAAPRGRAAARRRAAELLDRFDMAARAGHYPSQLSAGERQRVALMRALAPTPGVILADEPTGNLDGDNTALVCAALVEAARGGAAVLMATHSDAHDLRADRVLRLGIQGTTPVVYNDGGGPPTRP